MSGENSAAGVAIKLHQPGEGIDHGVLRITGALEQLDGVAVGGQFHGPAIVTGDNGSSDGRDGTATGKYFFQQSCTHADTQRREPAL